MKKIDFIHYSQLKKRPELKKRVKGAKRIHIVEAIIFIFVLTIFGLKITGYLHANIFNPVNWVHGLEHQYNRTSHNIGTLKYFGKCPAGEQKIDIGQHYLCRKPVPASIYQKIYDTYPIVAPDRGNIYPSLDHGSIQNANDLLKNRVHIDRFNTYSIGHNPQWTEDPYGDRYWRFNYYGLRPLTDLLYASRTTHNPVYTQKLLELTNSFINNGMNKPHAWDDYHAVAFRTMILTNIWWKLRAENALSVSDSTNILKALQAHGDFLEDRNHYEPEHNHGTNEAAALDLLAVSMPDLPHASSWKPVAVGRIDSSLDSLIDKDGVLIENSPYYHFYTLQKYWDLYHYAQRQHEKLGNDFEYKLNKMIEYATYILEPNSHIPLLGASLDSVVNAHNEYAQMAAAHPQLAYVLSQGQKGKRPSPLNKFYTTTGQTILRSGWGKGEGFVDQTQLTFDVGPYRTPHSDLDALSLTLYGSGKELLPDSGLYTYSPGIMRNYFHGTSAHNTVVVDGKDQFQGTATATQLIEKDGYDYQSAQHELYDGVVHERTIIMLDKKHVVVIDKMLSSNEHRYQQLFHLFPGAKLTKYGLTVRGASNNKNQSITIRQLATSGITENEVINQSTPKPNGICSEQYGKTLPCYAVSYNQKAKNATYATLLTIGPEDSKFNASFDAKTSQLHIKSSNKKSDFSFSQTKSRPSSAVASSPKPPAVNSSSVPTFDALGNWTAGTAGTLHASTEPNAFLEADNTPDATESSFTNDAVKLDISHKNITIKLKVKNRPNLTKLNLLFSNNNWQSSVSDDLLNDYKVQYDGEWLNISLGKSMLRSRNGHWQLAGGQFDWSKIDGVRLVARNNPGQATQIELGELSTLPEQQNGKVVIVFDDGYDSILPAADYLHKNGMEANVAVISKYVVTPSLGHLNLNDLKKLQNQYGWNMVNHTSQHQDAVADYYQKNNMEGYERDVLTGAKFLKDNGLDSAPNWFIYPHGATNYSVKKVVSKYYKFARTVNNDTEVYPFTDPLGVKTMSVQNAGDTEAGASQVVTTPEEVARAVADAKNYKTTLFLTFHRIHSTASDRPGYELTDFKKIVDNLKHQGIEVDTLSELDKSNRVSSNQIMYKDGVPAQTKVTLRIHRSILGEIGYVIGGILHKIEWVWGRIF